MEMLESNTTWYAREVSNRSLNHCTYCTTGVKRSETVSAAKWTHKPWVHTAPLHQPTSVFVSKSQILWCWFKVTEILSPDPRDCFGLAQCVEGRWAEHPFSSLLQGGLRCTWERTVCARDFVWVRPRLCWRVMMEQARTGSPPRQTTASGRHLPQNNPSLLLRQRLSFQTVWEGW